MRLEQLAPPLLTPPARRLPLVLPALNPFTPGSGLQPPTLAGRDSEIAAFDLLVAHSLGRRTSASIVLYGYRGVGKTVLLNAMRGQAERSGWLCIDVEAQSTAAGVKAVRQRMGRRLHEAADRFKNGKAYTDAVRRALGTLTGFSVSLGVVSVDIAREQPTGRAQSGELEVDLEELVEDFAEALRESGSAIGVFIDEMQDVDPELLSALLTVQNRAGQKGIPFYVVGAGLPTLPALLARTRSYAERLFDYRHIDALGVEAATKAIVQPFAKHNFALTEAALEMLLRHSNGYPYFLQVFGKETWNAAASRTITEHTAATAIEAGYAHLDQGFFPARWDRATTTERDLLRAMAQLGTRDCKNSDIAARAGLKSSTLSAARRTLIEKGVVFSPETGVLAFTVPGMPQFIQRQDAQ